MKSPVLMFLLFAVFVFSFRGVAQAPAPSEKNPARVEISRLPQLSIQKDWTDAGLFWLNAIVVLIGGVGVGLAWANLKTITGQLTEMQNSAKREAELNRPWLLFDEFKADGVFRNTEGLSHSKDGPKLRFKVINRGLTPAKVKAWEFRVEAGEPSKPVNPPLQPKLVSDVPIRIFPAGISCELESEYPAFDNGEQMRLGSLEMVLWFHGVARYEDLYGKTHESRFCFRSTDDPLLRCPTLEEAGPDEYRQIT